MTFSHRRADWTIYCRCTLQSWRMAPRRISPSGYGWAPLFWCLVCWSCWCDSLNGTGSLWEVLGWDLYNFRPAVNVVCRIWAIWHCCMTMAYCHQLATCENLSWGLKPITTSFVSLTLLTCYLYLFLNQDLVCCCWSHLMTVALRVPICPPSQCSPLTGLDGKARHSTLQKSLTAGSGEGSISWRGTFFHMDVRESQYLWTSGWSGGNIEKCKARKPSSK